MITSYIFLIAAVALGTASNIFAKEADSWKMIHHQAGGSQPPPIMDDDYEEVKTLQ